MLKFPAWVTGDSSNEDQLAQRRLRYLLVQASLETNEKASLSSLCQLAGLNHTHVYQAVREGHFSATMARAIEQTVGRRTLRREWLIHPLDIEEMVTA